MTRNIRAKRRVRPRWLPTGSISSGTLRAEDVVPDLLHAAEHWVSMSRADRNRVRRIGAEVSAAMNSVWDADTYEQEQEHAIETLSEAWSDLEDILTMYAPPGHYVGAHPGDGADIGVWASEEIPCVCPKVGNVTPDMLDDAAASDGPGDIVFELSDHGNLLMVWTLSVGKTRKWHGQEVR